MPLEENKALYRRWFEEVVSEGNLPLADELLADKYVMHFRGWTSRSIAKGTNSS